MSEHNIGKLIHDQLANLNSKGERIIQLLENIVATLDDLNAQIATLTTAATNAESRAAAFESSQAAAVTALQAQVAALQAAGGAPVDTSTQIAAIQTVIDGLNAVDPAPAAPAPVSPPATS